MITGGGLLTSNVANRLLRTFVIVDMTQMENVNFQQLGDYVAMVSLAQIDPGAETAAFETVLNLFSRRSGESMTDWDRAYLGALYGSELSQRNPHAQLGAVGSAMARDRRDSDEPETPQRKSGSDE